MEISFRQCALVCLLSISAVYIWKAAIKSYLFENLKDIPNAKSLIAATWSEALHSLEDSELRFHSVALGINSGVDVIVSGSELFRQMGISGEIELSISPIDHADISTLQQLQETFSYFHSKGAGGERFMSNKELFAKVVDAAKNMKETELYVGGNAALMAQTLSRVAPNNVKILFSGPVGPVLSPMLNHNILVPDNMKADDDEYHVILEYGKDEKWAGRVAPIASRFIFSHDLTNGKMLAFEKFIASIKEFHPDLIILTGFHLLEAQSEEYWRERMLEMVSYLKDVPEDIPIHLELASMATSSFVKEMSDLVFPLVHSIGLNEQELWLICQANGGPHCMKEGASLEGPPSPAVANDIIYWMLTKFSSRGSQKSLLTRIHFHTLPFHVVATLDSSRWRYGDTSVVAGAWIASTQSCGDETVQVDKVDLRLSHTISLSAGGLPSDTIQPHAVTFNPQKPIISWVSNGLNFSLTPVLVCMRPVKTVGLGDAISSMGLLFSGYSQGHK